LNTLNKSQESVAGQGIALFKVKKFTLNITLNKRSHLEHFHHYCVMIWSAQNPIQTGIIPTAELTMSENQTEPRTQAHIHGVTTVFDDPSVVSFKKIFLQFK
jgi:hypothetical protein